MDPDSSDTAEIIRFIEQRGKAERKAEKLANYEFGLASPFSIENKKVCLREDSLMQVRDWCRRKNIESRFLNDRHPIVGPEN